MFVNIKKVLELFAIFSITLTLYSLNTFSDFKSGDYRRLLTTADAVPNTFLSYNLFRGYGFDYNESVQHLRRFNNWNRDPYFLIDIDSKYRSVYPPLTGILAYPIFLPAFLMNKIPDIGNLYHLMKVLLLGRIAASIFASISTVFVYLTLRNIGSKSFVWKRAGVLLFTALYAFGTTTFSISSRSLWQHTVSQMVFAVIIFVLFHKPRLPSKYFLLLGFLVGLFVLTRPTNLIIALTILVYTMLFGGRKIFYLFVLGVLPCVALLLFYNLAIFGSPFAEGYGARNGVVWSSPLFHSILGYFLSPARSFLFISPPLLLSLFGIFNVFRDRTLGGDNNLISRFLGIGFLLTWALFMKWHCWDGADGFGYRMLTDFLPFLTILSFLIFQKLSNNLKWLVVILVLYSVLIQIDAVYFQLSRCRNEHNWDFSCLLPQR